MGIQAKREHFLGVLFEVVEISVEIIETHRISVEIIETQGIYGETEYCMKVLCFLFSGFSWHLFTLNCGPKDLSNVSLSGSLTSFFFFYFYF